ncbi:MAG TPA: M10 family metallopeptidase C-terminal domain-containing protein, partial [Roseimicrobium sp.]|nr:M10 family metallopeptidase C-terminal domain-containing protein [Roseimicrobium sp.]
MALKSYTTQEAAAAITRHGDKWGDPTLGTSATVSYGFLDYGLKFTEAQIAATKEALNLWSDVANIKFVTPADTPYVSGGIVSLNFVNFSDPNGATAHAAGDPSLGSVTIGFNLAKTSGTALAQGGSDMSSLIHEIGHAIGLAHPGDYNAGNPSPEYNGPNFFNAGYLQDTNQYSIMSYFPETHTGADFQGIHASTPLLHDIAAAQRLYGVNTETRKGDTTYGFHSNADREAFHIDDANEKVVFAIWDAGGTDTLDLSGYSEDQKIDLNPGAFTDAGGLRGNIAIAEGAYIENAKGGSGNDAIYGNGIRNVLNGGDGNDILDGRGGNDRMVGGLGDDTYYVDHSGDEVIDQQLVRTSLTGPWTAMNAGTDRIATTLSTYTLPKLIENLNYLGTGNFTGYGNALDNEFVGGGGNDKLYGYDGDDTFYGGGGSDSMWGGNDNDTFVGGAGSDSMYGGGGDDTYFVTDLGDTISEWNVQTKFGQTFATDAGGSDTVKTTLSQYTLGMHVENLKFGGYGGRSFEGTGNGLDNLIEGGSGGDILRGMGGNDTLNGLDGADTMSGGSGDDTYFVDNVGDVVSEKTGALRDAGGVDKVITSLNAYSLTAYVENLAFFGTGSFAGTGNARHNTITGGASADVLSGGRGNDVLEGNGGADTLLGGADNDTLKL